MSGGMWRFMRRHDDPVQGVPIVGVTGANGTGKTLLAVQACLADMRLGREVYSTVDIAHPDYGRSKRISSLRQLLELPRGATVLLDDVASIFSSRTTMAVPPEVVTMMHTVRHKDQRMIWTAPGWMRADTNIRLVTQAVLAVTAVSQRAVPGSAWKRTSVAAAVLLDTTLGGADDMPEVALRRRLVRLRRLPAFGAYDTHAPTPQIGGYVHSGTCPDCGGTRPRPQHSPELHEALGLPWYDDKPRGTRTTGADVDSVNKSETPA